jgi:hypothetical protein
MLFKKKKKKEKTKQKSNLLALRLTTLCFRKISSSMLHTIWSEVQNKVFLHIKVRANFLIKIQKGKFTTFFFFWIKAITLVKMLKDKIRLTQEIYARSF